MLIIIGIILLILLFYLASDTKEYFTLAKRPKKKIALCFLIYEEIYHEDIWYHFLKNVDKDRYSIYIHYKKNKPLKHFEKYKVPDTIETCWACLSIVLAQNLVLREALKDPNSNYNSFSFIFKANLLIKIQCHKNGKPN